MSFIDDFEDRIEKEIEHIDNLYELGYYEISEDDINNMLDVPENIDSILASYHDYINNGVV